MENIRLLDFSLEQKDHKPDSWMSLLKGMRATLKQKKFKQVPQLSTSRELDISQPFALSGVRWQSYVVFFRY